MASNKKLRVAIFGCGKMGLNHAQAIKFSNRAELVGVADPLVEPYNLKSIIGDINYYKDYKELLSDLSPDVVHICTPPATHAYLAESAIEKNANVYVEKPFTLSEADASEVIALAVRRNVKVCPGHQVLFEKPALRVQEFLKEIGGIVHIESYFSFRQVRRSISPVDQLIDILPHPVYVLLHFLKAANSEDDPPNTEIIALGAQAKGEVRAIIRSHDINVMLIVTLHGRPVESYLRVVGTNGSINADFVHGTVVKLAGPGTSAISIISNPYRQSKQILWESTKSFASLALKRKRSYPGLSEIIEQFYASILDGTKIPIPYESILETVKICEQIGDKLQEDETDREKRAELLLRKKEKELPPLKENKRGILVTGGTGYLGKKVAECLRVNGLPVRVIARRLPFYSARVPGVDYVTTDLGVLITQDILKDIEYVVHCAAETAGDKYAHERNTIMAARNIMEASARARVRGFIHISSLAVLKPKDILLDENSPVDYGNIVRGPYVWAKAEVEKISLELKRKLDLKVKIIRPAPLVDYTTFEAPGRLGREFGSFYIAMGSSRDTLSICDVITAVDVIKRYVTDYDAAPEVLNLVEPIPPTRGELLMRLLNNRPDLKPLWFPMFFIKYLSPILFMFQKLFLRSHDPLDIASAFLSQEYNTAKVEAFMKSECQMRVP